MSKITRAPRGVGDTNDWWINISRRHVRMGTTRLKCICNHLHRFGLNIFIHINENKHINKHYITMVYDGIQKEAIRLIRI